MKISTKGIYALEVMVDLAMVQQDEDMVQLESIKDIAGRRKLSEKYLERIVGMLKRAGLLKSTRGAYGGYELAKSAKEIMVLDVLQAVEGDLAPVHCLTKENDCGVDCDICPTRETWNEMWGAIQDTVKDTSIWDIKKLALEID